MVASLAISGCGYGESGVPPPSDQIFLPAALLADPGGEWLYVVNSNSDLRYNAGTLVAIDLAKVSEDRAGSGAPWGECPSSRFVPGKRDPERFCCRDRFDARILNCNERGYIDAGSTVRIGSFGGSMAQQTYERDGETVRRLFVAVRGEPSITYVDATFPAAGQIGLRCTGEPQSAGQAPNMDCSDAWKIRTTTVAGADRPLPEEPHSLAVDDALGALYVGHLGSPVGAQVDVGGVSVIDVCAPERERPRLADVNRALFPGARFQGITSLTLAEPGNPNAPIFATARFTSEVLELTPRGFEGASCAAGRDIGVVAGNRFVSAAFLPAGVDLRGFLLSPDGQRGYILHRRGSVADPSALVVIDRRPDSRGAPVNRPTDVIEVCGGPTEMVWHDAGRGPRIFVTCFEGGQIYVIDPSLPAVEGVVDVGRGPSRMVFPPSRVGQPSVSYVAGFADSNIAVIDLQPGSPTEYRVVQRIGFPHSLNR